MRNLRAFFLRFLFVLGLAVPGWLVADVPVDRCIAAIENIKSFDVISKNYVLEYPDYANTNKPDNAPIICSVFTNRDVFAAGSGRRFEQFIGESGCNMGVLDFRKAQPGEATLNDYGTYYSYINPVVDTANGHALNCRLFLKDLLLDPNAAIRPLTERQADSSLIAFQIAAPKFEGRFLRVWLDVEHGYLPKRVEWYMRAESSIIPSGPVALIERMEVDEFRKIEGTGWVPIRGTDVTIAPVGELQGRSMGGSGMEVDLVHSSWNSINSGDIFLPKSLPKVNYQKGAWKYDYSPAKLRIAKQIDEDEDPTHNRGRSTALVYLILGSVSAFTGLLIFAIVKQKPHEQ